jgi:hypothetical protein
MPVRTGIAMELTEKDLSAIGMLLPEQPWLLMAETGQFPLRQFIDAYLPPATATSMLRRGTAISVWRQIDIRNNSFAGEWTADRPGFEWAQLTIPGSTFDDIQNELDNNRPFRVVGRFDDGELVSLIEFLRSNATNDGNISTYIRPWAIRYIDRANDGSVRVMLLEKAMQGQSIHLRQTGQTWVVLGIGMWAA